MEFVNNGIPRQVRFGEAGEHWWNTISHGERVNLPEREGRAYGFDPVNEQKATEGKAGTKKIETKQFEPIEEKKNEDFQKKLRNINGIGKKTAEDIVGVYQTEEEMIKAIKSNKHIPFRDDIELKLRRQYGI